MTSSSVPSSISQTTPRPRRSRSRENSQNSRNNPVPAHYEDVVELTARVDELVRRLPLDYVPREEHRQTWTAQDRLTQTLIDISRELKEDVGSLTTAVNSLKDNLPINYVMRRDLDEDRLDDRDTRREVNARLDRLEQQRESDARREGYERVQIERSIDKQGRFANTAIGQETTNRLQGSVTLWQMLVVGIGVPVLLYLIQHWPR